MEEMQETNVVEELGFKTEQGHEEQKISKSFGAWLKEFWKDGARVTTLLVILLQIAFVIMNLISFEIPTSLQYGDVQTNSYSLIMFVVNLAFSRVTSGEIWGIVVGILSIITFPLIILSLVSLIRYSIVGGDCYGVVWTANVGIIVLSLISALLFIHINEQLQYAITLCSNYGIDLERLAGEMGYSLDISPFVWSYYIIGVAEILLSIVRCIFVDSKPIKIKMNKK